MSTVRLLYADQDGNILDHPGLGLAGSAGGRWETVDEAQCIPLPPGSELFLLPGRRPVGVNQDNGFEVVTADPEGGEGSVSAVAAFLAPAHTATLWAAYDRQPDAPNLPLFAYAAVGFARGRMVTTALRVDQLPRQDPERFPPPQRLQSSAQRLLRRFADNRLMQHLGHCALGYGCPAARNLMLGRWEAPLPTAAACNASCVGCISSQPEGVFPVTQERIAFTPYPEEVAEVALHHFATGRDPLVSFGQGCEGEPLTQGGLLEDAIRLIRAKEPKGTINLNSNGSLPGVVSRLMEAGLSSIRVSLNSLIPERHEAYYQPRGWSLADALESVKVVKEAGGHASFNLLTLPGVTDRPEEFEAIAAAVEQTGLDLIQWRNLNIDPEVYLEALGLEPPTERLGIPEMITALGRRFPALKHGYFNPKLESSRSS
ncbi:MAG: radical SAM protein [Desulfarculaceae bacterium]|nr:radical SAM protein [Desulfarculaceae bacterium]MCF8071734.1 radical SAM protein [Desulfarculaceae bacterium]MCF8102419.1 radical SAM protein [Desulfarculaceae bacterium]MCF8116761.1 radical SAM protein [Desulfarculaceae bacterium]